MPERNSQRLLSAIAVNEEDITRISTLERMADAWEGENTSVQSALTAVTQRNCRTDLFLATQITFDL